jgi:acyl dehydratase
MRYWQDINSGESFETHDLEVTREEIVEFATEFDPQPYHLDTEAAESSIFGGLCASGWQVSALMMRLLTDTFKRERVAVKGVCAVSRLRWKMPVFAGDRLTALISVTDTSSSSDWPGQGSIVCDVLVKNHDGKPVIELSTTLLIACREEQGHD